MTGSPPRPGRRHRRSHPDRHHAVHAGRAAPGPAGGLQPLVRAGPLLRRLPDRRLQLRRGPVRGHRAAEGPALPARATGRPGGRPDRSAATSASTTCSTATTTSGTGGRSTRSTCSTPPAGCSSSGTTSTPACTASSGSTAATRTGCRPSSPWTTGSRAWCRSSSSRPTGSTPRPARCTGTATEYLPSVLPGSAGGHRARLQPAAPAGRRPRRRAPRRRPSTERVLLLCFLDEPPDRLVGRGLRRSGRRRWPTPASAGCCGPRRSSAPCPGTDTYTDQLWAADPGRA